MGRLENTIVLMAAFTGLILFQRVCEDILISRRRLQAGSDLHNLYRDDHLFPGDGQHSITFTPDSWNQSRRSLAALGGLGPSRTQCKKIMWFMGIRAENAAQQEYYRYLQVALLSARRNAPSLVPYLLFDGAPNEVTAWFERQGGRVVLHQLSLEPMLQKAVNDRQQQPEWFANRGAFLRLDVPSLFPGLLAEHHAGDDDIETDYFLYTDNDVIFLKDVTTCSFRKPPLFTIGPEHDRGKPENTGIMYVNATAFSEFRGPLIEFAVAGNWNFPASDQGLILSYMHSQREEIPVLPDIYNWKGYWGSDENATIVHFHGPKPERCLPCLCAHPSDFKQACGPEQQCPDVYGLLFERAGDGGMFYKRMLQMYHVLRWDAEHS